MKTLVIIPSRLSATRLPGKPLLKINGLSIISHVFKKAEEANIGEVIVATGDQEIIDDVKKNGGQAILTNNQHQTGTDRIYEAIEKIDNSNIDLVMNLQGDEPLMNIDDIKNLNNQMIKNNAELGTLASNILEKEFYQNQNIVKVITNESLNNSNFPEALDFMRKISDSRKNIYHHLGIYCYQKETLKNFISFNQSSNEAKHKLEQLRALDNNIKINVALAKSSPIGVDTEEDLMAIKKIMEYK
ncbi:3-deoxy-manno-octulosonate cytidylyltransferase [Candidatus Pelagibacter sp.]|nr:3-deoxy-manno-octulosonate cytidylyltransferase [Candidatus Pelagibacter sp.]